MKVGFVGLGKLGLPVAISMASRGIEVLPYDLYKPDIAGAIKNEAGFQEVWDEVEKPVQFCASVGQMVNLLPEDAVIFIAVQTPHEPRFEGVTPLPQERADFDYSYLIEAVQGIVDAAGSKPLTLSVISTVLPGTMAREVQPLLPANISLVYNPSFIAMGTTVQDFLDPEFVLLGGDDKRRVEEVYRNLEGWTAQTRCRHMSIPDAELTKVSYNTFIGLKIAFANTVMEVCYKTDCDVDEVMGALKLANRRLISPAYLDGGMGDGGGCHPRDNIALSWLARELHLSHDLFHDAMKAREDQTRWLCSIVHHYAVDRKISIGILGEAYKPGSHLTAGSPARLAKCILHDHFGWPWNRIPVIDPYTGKYGEGNPWEKPRVWLVGCKHPNWPDITFTKDSVIIDPWRYIPDQEGVEVVRVGQAPG